MQTGAVFPQTEIGSNPSDVSRYGQAVEEMGFDYLLAYEHVIGANPDRPGGWEGRPYDYNSLFYEPFVLFGYLAALTQRLQFATGILILPQRQTVLVAKQAATLDVLSTGRLRLGIGVGWNPVEYEALGQEFRRRGRRQEEQVALLRRLWTERLVTFEGDFHSVPDAGILPLPVQQPIPIWFGGGADAALRRMARLGDGWMPNTMDTDRLDGELAKLRGYIREAGRDPSAFGVDVRISYSQAKDERWPEILQRLRELGVSHVSLNTMGCGFQDLDQHLDVLERFRKAAAAG